MVVLSIPAWLGTYAWFIGVAVVVLQLCFRWVFLQANVRDASDNVVDWRLVLLCYYSSQALVFFLCGVFQFAGDYKHFYYVLVSEDHLNAYVLLPRLAMFGYLIGFLVWILSGGDQIMIKYGFSGTIKSAKVVRLYNLVFIIGLTSMLMVSMFTDTFR